MVQNAAGERAASPARTAKAAQLEESMIQQLKQLNPARWLGLAFLVALASLVLAGCNALDDNQIGFWDILWSMVVFFFWFMLIWIWISLFADIFRRDDLSGGMKAVWILVLFILPLLGALIYIIARPKATPQDVRMMAQAEAASKAAGGVSTADELAKLAQLRDSGVISVPEYEKLKAQIIGS
jgi:ABC-type multidrug transport system fused ATPase/permease subunit